MFKELKMKIAANRVQRSKARKKAKKSNRPNFWRRLWRAACTPVKAVWGALCSLWAWIKTIDLIGLVNTTLLCAIIALFSMLIIDIVKCHKTPVVIVANAPAQVNKSTQTIKPVETAAAEQVTLPVRRDAQSRKFVAAPVNVVPVKKCSVSEKQTARTADKLYGDVIIDSRGAAKILKPGDKIYGNLYLQNMRKYALPCDIKVNGNLFLRDLGLLQFCGDFTVTGNIYVSPNSSFGAIPATARIGGQVIL